MTTLCPTPLEALAAFPSLQAELATDLEGLDLEGEQAHEWLGTRLMALWRDRRRPEIFEALYAHSQASVAAWIRSLLAKQRSRLDSRELLQDTFVNVFRYPNSFRDEHPKSFRVWVRTIAGNLIKRAKRPTALRAVEYPEGWQEPADGRRGPADQLAIADESLEMRKAWSLFLAFYAEAFKTLSERDQKALVLVEVDELPYRDAGAILGVTRSNMKMIVFRARRRLAKEMRRRMASESLPIAA